MRKKIIYMRFLTVAFCLFFQSLIIIANGQGNRVTERIYLSTDRGSYIAGERLWISAYCIDLSDSGRLSGLSSVAYVELCNKQSMVLEDKIVLVNGRGAGALELPPSLPTGTYKIYAYTRHMLNEEKLVPFEKNIAVFNVLSAEKIPGNVVTEEDENGGQPSGINHGIRQLLPSPQEAVQIEFSGENRFFPPSSSIPVTLVKKIKDAVSFSISVARVDSLPVFYSLDMMSCFDLNSVTDVKMTDNHIPEYEGEIIRGRVTGSNDISLTDKLIYLSPVGGEPQIYSAVIDSAGEFTFYTSPIYGEREIVLQVPYADSNTTLSYELFDPFAKFVKSKFPVLKIAKNIENTLTNRSIEMQLGRRFGLDTLFEYLTTKKDPLLRNQPVVYLLDNYTRFPLMPDVILEYIQELRFRKIDDRRDLQVRWEDGFRSLAYSRGSTLVTLDGIPLFDHSKIYDYDPLKVKSISVYGAEYYIGDASYEGIVSFRTYKGDYNGLTFGRSTRILDYHGFLYPVRFIANNIRDIDNFPDLRSLLYWDPIVEIDKGGKREIIINTSSVPGRYLIRVEGISANGIPFSNSLEFFVQ